MGEPNPSEEYLRALAECRASILRCQAARRFIFGPKNFRAAPIPQDEWRATGNHGVPIELSDSTDVPVPMVPRIAQESLLRIAASSRRLTEYLISQHPWLEVALNDEDASEDVVVVRVVPPPANLPPPVPPPAAEIPVDLPPNVPPHLAQVPYPSDVGSPAVVVHHIRNVVPGSPISSIGSS